MLSSSPPVKWVADSVVGLRAEHIIFVMRINILNLPAISANLSPQYPNQKTGRHLGDH